jgi:hypothetical protein
MTLKRFRQFSIVLASSLLAFVAIRRIKKQMVTTSVPSGHTDRLVINWQTPLPAVSQESSAEALDSAVFDNGSEELELDEDEDEAQANSYQRKVSRTRRISFRGKRYGPLPEELVGQLVEVQVRDNQIEVLIEGASIATCDLE